VMSNQNEKGQSLLEVVIALGVIVVVLVGLVKVTTQSVRNTSSSQNESLTARYATEVSEWLKNERDTLGWVGFKAAFISRPGTWCLPTSPLTIHPTQSDLTTYISSLVAPSPKCPAFIAGSNTLFRTITLPTNSSPYPTPPSLSRTELMAFVTKISWDEGENVRTAVYEAEITSAENP